MPIWIKGHTHGFFWQVAEETDAWVQAWIETTGVRKIL